MEINAHNNINNEIRTNESEIKEQTEKNKYYYVHDRD